jgi:Uma2 family endonuclease
MARGHARSRPDIITGKELSRMGDVGPCELIDGRIVPMTPTSWKHGRIELRLAAKLDEFVSRRDLGWVMTGEVGIYTQRSPDRVRGADVTFLSRARSPQEPPPGFLEVSPDLVAEVASPDDRWQELRQKIEEYFSAGIEQVWIVEPENRAIVVYTSPTEGRRYSAGDLVKGAGSIEGFELEADALFE